MSSLIVEVVKIKEILPHGNADRLEIAMIKDWSVITGKGTHKAGDLVIYVPVDSVLTEEFIKKNELKIGENYINTRIRAAKIRGVVSYGMILPISILGLYGVRVKEGQDVAASLGITKYEEPDKFTPHRSADEKIDNVWKFLKWKVSNLFSRRKSNEHFRKYTDIENFRHFPTIFQDGEHVTVTEKLHGTNARYGWLKKEINVPILKHFYKGYEFCIGSHNVQKGNNANWVYNKIAKKYDLADLFKDWKGYIFFGEIIGPGVQDLTYGLKEIDIYFFDIMKPDGKYMNWNDAAEIYKNMGLKVAPWVYTGKWEELVKETRAGKSLLCPTQIREGVVIKPIEEVWDHKLGRKILKLISEDYLLRKGGSEYK
jgi:RNA ligase (TIGR02306 family)